MALHDDAFPLIDAERYRPVFERYDARLATYEGGEMLWTQGQADYCFHYVLSGSVRIEEEACSTDGARAIAEHGPGHFAGDEDLLSGRPAIMSARAVGQVEALIVSASDVRQILRLESDLGGVLLNAFLARRRILQEDDSDHGLRVVGSSFDPETLRVREFLQRNRILFTWIRPESPEGIRIMEWFGVGPERTPMVLGAGDPLFHASLEVLGDRLNVRKDVDQRRFDLVVVGAGPAGLAAAVYGASEGLSTLLLDSVAPGGQASWSSRIENYMGFPTGITGEDLADAGRVQAEKFGAVVSSPATVERIECVAGAHALYLTSGEEVRAGVVLVATGATYRRLDAPGYTEFEGRGIYYAATATEVEMCSGSEVVVVGAGNSAGQAVVFLSSRCSKVRLVVRGDDLRKSMSAYLANRIEGIANVEVLLETEVVECSGTDSLDTVRLKGAINGCVEAMGLFCFIGARPNTDFLRGTAAMDDKGFVLTGEETRDAGWPLKRAPHFLETSCPGVLAAGDCRAASIKRVASAVGEGSMSVAFAHRLLAQ